METSDEENFVAISSPSDAEFDTVVGYLEAIIIDDDFQLTQRTFMEKHYREFDDSEEYKLIYTFIFNEYISIVKKYMEEKLLDLIPGFDMTAFTMSLQTDVILLPLGFRQIYINALGLAILQEFFNSPTSSLYRQHKDEMASELFDMLLTFTDFPAFKEMFLDYKAEKEGQSLDLSSGLVVTSLNK